MIDTHCHLDSPRLETDREAVLARAWNAGVSGIMVPAVAPDDWETLLTLPASEPRLQIGLGIHPQLLPALPEQDDDAHLERLDALLGRGVALAVGECGLDGGSVPGAPLERQLKVLRAHFDLARKHGLPLLVHCLRLQPALRAFLEEQSPLPEAGVLLHSYSGGPDLVRVYARLGCHFSFAGPVTFPQGRKPLEAARQVPAERLLAETDAPDQSPHPHRGERNEPAHLPLVIAGLAAARGEPLEVVVEQTTRNAHALFRSRFGAD